MIRRLTSLGGCLVVTHQPDLEPQPYRLLRRFFRQGLQLGLVIGVRHVGSQYGKLLGLGLAEFGLSLKDFDCLL